LTIIAEPPALPALPSKKSLLTAAIKLALRDFAVFPLISNAKSPSIGGGFKSASKEPQQLTEWFGTAQGQNLGVVTGEDSGVWVLDVDIKNGAKGFESLSTLQEKHGPLPPTLVATTTSGGKHFYFIHPPSLGVRNRTALLSGIDVRGNGGYVVAPPSIIDGSQYTWDDENAVIADAPEWLIDFVLKKQPFEPAQLPSTITEGSRNSSIMRFAQQQMRKGHAIDVVTDSMLMVNAATCVPPLEEIEVVTVVQNVFRLYDEEVDFNCTELGSAKRMAMMNKGKLRFVIETRQWLNWNGNLWQLVDENRVYAAGKEVSVQLHIEAGEIFDTDKRARLKKHAYALETRRGLDNMIKLLESEKEIATHVSDLDQHGFLLPVKNGVVDLKTGQHAPPDQSLLLTHGTDVCFDASAKCPQWERFLREVMNGDQELVTYVRRAIGYNLTDRTSEHKLFFLYGFGANGKSTFLNVLRALLGDLGTQAAGETVLESKRNSSGPSGDIARLRGKRLVAISELDDGKHLAEAMVKSLTGGDAITARHLYGRDFTFTPVAKFWIAANHKPTIKGNDNGIWRRIKMIPFTATFSEAQQDKDLERKLMAELPGILNWAIAGCIDWQLNGLPDAVAIKNATKEYRSEMDILALWLDECAVVGKKYEVKFADAHDSFKPWGMTNYNCEYSGIKFGKLLAERGFEKTTRPHRGYKGLQLREGFGSLELRHYDRYKGYVKAICAIEFKPDESDEDQPH